MSGAWLRTEAGVYPSTADRCLKTPMKDASGPWGLGPLCAIACMIHEPSIATLALRERESTDYAEQISKKLTLITAIHRSPRNNPGLGITAHGMSRVLEWVQADASDPKGNQPSLLARRV